MRSGRAALAAADGHRYRPPNDYANAHADRLADRQPHPGAVTHVHADPDPGRRPCPRAVSPIGHNQLDHRRLGHRSAEPGEVAYGETPDYTSQTADPAISVRHAVTLTNLAPYTLYHYRIQTLGWPLSEDFTFRTAADPSQTSFTFAVFGDTRSGHDIHRAIIDRLVALAPDFAIHTGDLVGDGALPSEWNRFLTIEAPLMAHVPLFPTLGDHQADSPLYFDIFYLPGNEHWYTFDYGNARFVCVDVDGYAHFGTASEQYAWLEATLAANTQPWLFVYLHVPPYSSLGEDSFEVAVRQTLTPLFERTGVDAVFSGHHHDYQRSVVNGITYIISGGGGAPLLRHPTRARTHHVP